jgi:hypothetical protein
MGTVMLVPDDVELLNRMVPGPLTFVQIPVPPPGGLLASMLNVLVHPDKSVPSVLSGLLQLIDTSSVAVQLFADTVQVKMVFPKGK